MFSKSSSERKFNNYKNTYKDAYEMHIFSFASGSNMYSRSTVTHAIFMENFGILFIMNLLILTCKKY